MLRLSRNWRKLPMAIAIGIGIASLCAQENPCPITKVHVQVEDTSGDSIQGLVADNFKASLGKDEVAIQRAEPGHAPSNIVILQDMSGSMHNNFAARSSLLLASEIIRQSPPEARFAVMAFADKTYIDQDFTSDRKLLGDAIQKYTDTRMWRGSTTIYDALRISVNHLHHKKIPPENSEIILLTDGIDTGSESRRENAEAELGASGVNIIAVGIDSPDSINSSASADRQRRDTLDRLARASGGIAIWLRTGGPATESHGVRREYKVEKGSSNIHDIAGELIREMSAGYELEIGLPSGFTKPVSLKLEIIESAGNGKRKLTLLYPEKIYPCRASSKN